MSSVFEPGVALAVVENGVPSKDRIKFGKNWKENVSNRIIMLKKAHAVGTFIQVENRVKSWDKSRANQSQNEVQLTWVANAVEYTNNIWQATNTPKSAKDQIPRTLGMDVPLFGPRFIPPGYFHQQKRHGTNLVITPATSYI